MTDTGLSRLYDRLTPMERFSLFLDAMYRDDTVEIERLGRSCPRNTYRMTDVEYTDLVEGSERVPCLFTLLWFDALSRVELAETAHAAF